MPNLVNIYIYKIRSQHRADHNLGSDDNGHVGGNAPTDW